MLCQVLAGMGGVGKTQLAAHYARNLWQSGRLELLVWVTAASRHAIITAYAQAAADLLGADPGEPERAANAFLAWLERKPGSTQQRWLIVLDDVTNPADLRGLWPPSSPHGRTVVTTRQRDAAFAGPERRLVPIGLFTPQEAVTYLTAALAAHDHSEPTDHLVGLAADLGYLPLALSQAVAYLIDMDLDCASYRGLLADHARTLTEVLPHPTGLPDDQAGTVATVWSLSIDRANQLHPAGLARPMLQLAALLDPNGIPEMILTSGPALAYLNKYRTTRPGPPRAAQVTVDDAVGALRVLHRLNLIDHTPRGPDRIVRVHHLIQRAAREAVRQARRDEAADVAADALTDVWPDVERDIGLAQVLRANADAVYRVAPEALWKPDAHYLLARVGNSLGDAGQVVAAAEHFQRMADDAHERLGAEHPDTIAFRHCLAQWRGAAGDVAAAADALARLVDDAARALGAEDPVTLTIRHNHAHWQGEAGDAVGAAEAFARLLTEQERILGSDHPRVLTTRHNLARWHEETGDIAGAVAEYSELVQHMQQTLGPDHPQTLKTRSNLAWLRVRLGDTIGAVGALSDLLADQQRALGEEHPDTLQTRNDLASCRGISGDPADAARALDSVLNDRTRMLGPDHPDTLQTRNDLAHWHGKAGNAEEAVSAYRELLVDCQRIFGSDHPHTLDARHKIAIWQVEAGHPTQAIHGLTEVIEQMSRVLGADHRDTFNARQNRAHAHMHAGGATNTARELIWLLADRTRALGPDHSDTLATRASLAQMGILLGEVHTHESTDSEKKEDSSDGAPARLPRLGRSDLHPNSGVE